MAKSATYLLRLTPEKKAIWQERAKESDMSLSAWIEGCCDIHAFALDLCDTDEVAAAIMVKRCNEAKKDMLGPEESKKLMESLRIAPLGGPRRERKPVGKIAAAMKKEGK